VCVRLLGGGVYEKMFVMYSRTTDGMINISQKIKESFLVKSALMSVCLDFLHKCCTIHTYIHTYTHTLTTDTIYGAASFIHSFIIIFLYIYIYIFLAYSYILNNPFFHKPKLLCSLSLPLPLFPIQKTFQMCSSSSLPNNFCWN
jgi:hypothetical protein